MFPSLTVGVATSGGEIAGILSVPLCQGQGHTHTLRAAHCGVSLRSEGFHCGHGRDCNDLTQEWWFN